MANDLFDARVVSAPQVTVEHTDFTSDVTEGLRLAHYCALEEFVGLAFCVITVAYIVTSFASLKP
ncbi:MAG: hypothetical protein WBY93_14560 [Candidatus Binatus sp.]|jgi:hypothetical protein